MQGRVGVLALLVSVRRALHMGFIDLELWSLQISGSTVKT